MKSSCIDYNETGYFSSTITSYLEQDPRLSSFISYQPTIEGFKQLINNKKVSAGRKILVEELQKQYSDPRLKNEESELVYRNIELLADNNTYTVTTGHQLNLFTGPLYFLYKIVTAINLATELKSNFPDKNFVPVYWMATEDHDFAEINHTKVHGKLISWDTNASGATGRIKLDSIAETVKEYKSALGISSNSEELASIIQTAYLEHDNLADATRYLVHSLFGRFGLVIIDADRREFKRQFASIIEADLINNTSFNTISNTSERLEEQGFKTQVNAREINFFYLKDGFRERITQEGDVFYVLNSEIRFSKEELINEVQNFPERFSPNVIMRPLYQEIILPNLAYIGGGAEIVYWLQLKKNFDAYNTDFPILILRNSALVFDKAISPKLSALGLGIEDLFKKTEEIKNLFVRSHTEHDLTLSDEWTELSCIFEKIKLRAYKIDPTLSPSTEAVKARLKHALSNLEKKLLRAEKRNHAESLTQIENIRRKFFPGESLQERSENFGLLYVKFGKNFIDELVEHFKPLDFKFTILEP
mgnify:CR=1 FL=1